MPAVQNLETGEPSVFGSTIGKGDLMPQSGATDIEILPGRGFISFHGWISNYDPGSITMPPG
jgi:hypothetical protein